MGGEVVCRVERWPVPTKVISRLKARLPRDPSQRSAKAREDWIIAHFLGLPVSQDLLQPPFELRRGSQIDILAVEAGRTVGIEIAELIHEVEAVARSEQYKQDLEVAFHVSPTAYPTRASRRNIAKDIVSGRGAAAFSGAAPELCLAGLTEQLIRTKCEKSRGYGSTDARLLLLYRSTGLINAGEFERSGARARIEGAISRAGTCFDGVVILASRAAWLVGSEPPQDFFNS